ncbi:unnamed protein product [Sphenostylis stenocarpa]|uniref:Uncharacterized protein n=1 Tax=Sphenostylis stenocarpa TaxID=92480 RepID=A0AA86VXG6_9FABA|nr:unnamed protein product [Sphenostylis stenocarpa]
MSEGREKMTKTEAIEYLREVQKKFEDKNEEFQKFLDIMTYFRIHRIDVGTVVEQVGEILRCHDDLILGFNKFLPKGYEILLPPKGAVQMEDAVKYVQKIKDRFRNKYHIYSTFVKILSSRKQNHMPVQQVFNEVSVVYLSALEFLLSDSL